jgi:thiamine-phosphate pyrophosphorylase
MTAVETAPPGRPAPPPAKGRDGRSGLLGPLLVVTDRHQARHPLEAIAEAVGRGGGRWLLLREKDLALGERLILARRLAIIARHHGMHFSVSTDLDLAEAVEAAGVHLQQAAGVGAARRRLGNGAVIGVSAHNMAELAAAAAAHADYATLSPIILTDSKPDYGPALGVAALAAAAKFKFPVLALGGITAETAGPCLAAGASGIAVMGEIMRSDDPGRTVADLLHACARTANAASQCSDAGISVGSRPAEPSGTCIKF